MINQLVINGNLVKDAELKTLADNQDSSVLNFTIAHSEKKDDEAIFLRCSLWGDFGKVMAPYLTKGKAVVVTGAIHQNSWINKEGQERREIAIKVNGIHLEKDGKKEEKDGQ